jgi:polysaccharide deacetylase family protein (PEP-CTERM system associated)
VTKITNPFETKSAPRAHLLTIGLEDYFQVGTPKSGDARSRSYPFESRLEDGLQRTLEILDAGAATATFFVLGRIAERYPELVRSIAERGHEVASSGYENRRLSSFTAEEFREDLARTREALERAVRQRIHGHRVWGWMPERHIWALDVLADAGYTYDASLRPRRRSRARDEWRRVAHVHSTAEGDKTIWEYPVSTLRVADMLVPAAGGNFIRRFPRRWVRGAIASWEAKTQAPFVFYFQTWELDPGQLRLNHASLAVQLRHHRKISRVREQIRDYLARYRFTSIAESRGLSSVDRRVAVRAADVRAHSLGDAASASGAGVPEIAAIRVVAPAESKTPVTIVVPCHNDAPALRYFGNTLASLEWSLAPRYDLRFLLVDDGSTDGTHEALQLLTAGRTHYRVLRHATHHGVSGAILAGLRGASTEIVASIDCDCTYDAHDLARMIPLLTDDVAMVTASPYHPQGSVRGVARWRLGCSKLLSRLYRRILRTQLHTYTSAFRVYRRSAVAGITLARSDYLGLPELIARLDGTSRIVEHPTTLSAPEGRTTLSGARLASEHLVQLAAIAAQRWLRWSSATPVPQPTVHA